MRVSSATRPSENVAMMNGVAPFALALLWLTALVVIVQEMFGIFYETNDDVGMMMLAHGFGLASRPTDLLLYSNRLQGLVIMLLGWHFGIPGYSMYLFVCLLIGAGAIVASLTRLNGLLTFDLLLVSVLLVRPIFAPQFTIVAGFLAMGAVASLLCFERFRLTSDLVVAASLGFLAFLMRVDALGLIVLLSAPAVLRMSLITARSALTIGLIVIVVTLAAWYWNVAGYDTPGWALYRAVDPLRAWFTDFGMTRALLAKPALLHHVGWSVNDALMIKNWWFFDPTVYSIAKLREIVDLLGITATFSFTKARLLLGLEQFVGPSMMPTTALMLVTLLFVPRGARLRAAAVVVVLIALALVISSSGRLDVTRVYYPGACLAIVYSWCRLSRRAVMVLAVVAVLTSAFTLTHYIQRAEAMKSERRAALVGIAQFSSHSLLFDWAGSLPYQALYPAFVRRVDVPPLRIYSLGSDQLAPYALARWGGDPEGVVDQFTRGKGVSIIANDALMQLLAVYCVQHWRGHLQILSRVQLGYATHYQARCR